VSGGIWGYGDEEYIDSSWTVSNKKHPSALATAAAGTFSGAVSMSALQEREVERDEEYVND
jgi:hypothetical protein